MEAIAKLRNHPTSPRKMRLMADLIRGKNVSQAMVELNFSAKHTSLPLKKLILSAISNWKQKNNSEEISNLFVKTIFVDEGRSLKRMLPAPQGRAYRMKKRSNHVTVIVDSRVAIHSTTQLENLDSTSNQKKDQKKEEGDTGSKQNKKVTAKKTTASSTAKKDKTITTKKQSTPKQEQ